MNIVDSNGFGLLRYFAGRCAEGKYQGKEALLLRSAAGPKVVVIAGGGTSADYARIKGNSYGMVYISEVNECHQSFFQEALDRTLASSDRRLFFDMNPKPPGHWFYRDFLDYQQKMASEGRNPGFNYERFTIFDNLSVSPERLKSALDSYDKSSLWYQAEILGRRVAATGRIYETFRRSEAVAPKTSCFNAKYDEFSIGVDVGGADATAATLVGFVSEGGRARAAAIDGFYHRQGKEAGFTHDAYAKRIVEKILEWADNFPGFSRRCHIFCESADKLFRQALKNELDRSGVPLTVYPSYKKDGVLYRIRLTSMLLNQGRLTVAAHLTKWIEAFENAVWDERGRERGEWIRMDNGSYPVDCLDSLEYAITPFKGKLLASRRAAVLDLGDSVPKPLQGTKSLDP
jgi:PBSX family phage terminase large subunit